MSNYQMPNARLVSPAVKNLLIVNGLLFLATLLLPHLNLIYHLGGFYFQSPLFRLWQPLTSMFMHGSIAHIAFNMFALWIFGTPLEKLWGSKRFLIFYVLCGLGAYFLHDAVTLIQTSPLKANLIARGLNFNDFTTLVKAYPQTGQGYGSPAELSGLFMKYVTPVVGASGAIYGLLIAFGMYFPDAELMLIFFPVPIKAKYFVPLMMLLELFLGWRQFSGDNIAHFAHIGGALVGFLIIRFLYKRREQ